MIQEAGFTRKTAQIGAVTLIQRFGSALNLNVHFHMLFLDGVYTAMLWGKSRFHRTNAPDQQELTELVYTVSYWVARFLEREGILERDEENSYLNLEEGDEDSMQQVSGCSVSYRIALGPQQGRKVFTLQTIPSWEDDDRFARVAKVAGFSRGCGISMGTTEAGEAMLIYIKTGGLRETPIIDPFGEYSLRRDRNHKCRGRRDAQERANSKRPTAMEPCTSSSNSEDTAYSGTLSRRLLKGGGEALWLYVVSA